MSFVLVIDDDPTQRMLACAALRKAGHLVAEAADGESGLEAVRQHSPDLVVCDVLMPGMNGYEVVAAMRSDPEMADMPVMLLTSLSDHEHMRAGMTAGADDYLAKPFKGSDLVASVTAQIDKNRKQRQAVAERVQQRFAGVLEEQRQTLAQRYEQRLVEEVSARWETDLDADGSRTEEKATVLLVDLFGALFSQLSASPELGNAVRSAYIGASDTALLFGAQYVQPYGSMMLALFVPRETGASPAARAVRTAQALGRAARNAVEPTVSGQDSPPRPVGFACGIAEGAVTLVTVQDPLHGRPPINIIAGDAVEASVELARLAREEDWLIACTQEIAAECANTVGTGRIEMLGKERGFGHVRAIELL